MRNLYTKQENRRHWIIATLVAVLLIAGGLLINSFRTDETSGKPAQNNVNVPAVKIVQPPKPIDLTGEWTSGESTAGTKFLAHIKNNTVLVEMSATDGFSNLWYGTFDILQPGEKKMVSKAILDDNVFVLSNAETKDFRYQDDGSLQFDFSVMGTRTTITLKRV